MRCIPLRALVNSFSDAPRFLALLLLLSLVPLWLEATPTFTPETETPASDREALLEGYYEQIHDLSFRWGDVGSILEAIVYVEFQKRYPEPDYEIIPGTTYHDESGRTLGEIDILVYDRRNDRVLAVYEVKLTGSPGNAGKQANRQLARLKRAIEENTIDRFRTPEGYEDLGIRDFHGQPQYGKIGSWETKGKGWTHSVDLFREEGDLLQEKILSSQEK